MNLFYVARANHFMKKSISVSLSFYLEPNATVYCIDNHF